MSHHDVWLCKGPETYSTHIYESLIKVLAPRVSIHCFDLLAFPSVEFTLEKGKCRPERPSEKEAKYKHEVVSSHFLNINLWGLLLFGTFSRKKDDKEDWVFEI